MEDAVLATAELYRLFAERQARGVSNSFHRWATGVTADPRLLSTIAALPPVKRQPNLVFAALRWHGAEPGDLASLCEGLTDRWDTVRHTILGRSTQTNEPARCAVMLPLLNAIPGPLALIELGAAAGLCLVPDRYSYHYSDGTRVDPHGGPSDVVINCRVLGGHLPQDLKSPNIVWRAGLDLNPLDPSDPDTAAWLSTLVWPEQEHRRQRLSAALRLLAAEPVRIDAGDLRDGLGALLRQVPRGVTPVVMHSATFAYLDDEDREVAAAAAAVSGARWVSFEGRGVVPLTRSVTQSGTPDTLFVAALDGEPLALANGHGDAITLLAHADA